jgi:guanine deaminase
MEADITVLDLQATPLLTFRMAHCASIQEALFLQMILGDDRSTKAVYVAGSLAYARAEVGR